MSKVNAVEVDAETTERGETCFERKRLAAAAGGEAIGCSLYELPAGKRAWPYHYHEGNEEAVFVLSGEGTIRLDGDSRTLREGDYVALPAGEDSAHRVINDSDGPLRYLVVSTMNDPDVTVYPDSGKVGVYAGAPPGGRGERTVSGYFPRDADVNYWKDEEAE
jgi:uncharacterized cupin superfamily protein